MRPRLSLAALGSLKARLVGVLAILGTLLLGVSATAIWQARETFLDAGSAVRAVPDRILLSRIAAAIGRDMLDVYAAILATDALDGERRRIVQQRLARDDAIIDVGLARMTDRTAAAAIDRAVAGHRALRLRMLTEAGRSALVRDLGTATTWLSSSEAILTDLSERGDRIIPLDAVIDAEMAVYLSLLQEVDRLKHHATLRGTLVGGHIASRSYLSIPAVRRMEVRTGKIDLAEDIIAERLIALGGAGASDPHGALRTALSDHRTQYDALIGDGEQGPADGSPASWYASLDMLLTAAESFEDRTVGLLTDHVTVRRAAASTELMASVALGLVAFLLVASSTFVVLRQVAEPLRHSVAQLGRLTRGEVDLDTSRLPRRHELGDLRQAIERLAGELRDAKRLKAEAEAHRIEDETRRAAEAEAERNRLLDRQMADRAARDAAERQRMREAAVAGDVAEVATACANGNFDRRAATDGREGAFLDLCLGVNEIGEAASAGLRDIEVALASLSRGDLTPVAAVRHAGIFARILLQVDRTGSSLGAMIRVASEGATRIRGSSSEIATAAEGLASRSETSAAALQEIAVAMSQIADMVATTAKSAERTREIARETEDGASAGVAAADRTISAMTEIETLSAEIAGKITLIEDVAFQTNLLALNAGVEAARAGNAGAGFKVVAMEIRSLAERASRAAESIGDLIGRSARAVGNGADLVRESGAVFRTIAASTTALSDEAASVAHAARQQSDAMAELDRSVSAIESDIQENTAMFETSRRLDDDATDLTRAFERFTIAEDRFAWKAIEDAA